MKYILFILFFSCIILSNCTKSGSGPGSGGSYAHDKNVGASAYDLLNGSSFNSLKIEIQYMPGYEPQAASIDHMIAILHAYLNKPIGIEVVMKEIPAIAKSSLSVSDVVTIEGQNRTVYTSGNTLGVYFLFTNGNYNDANVLGIAYRNTSMCLFGKKIADNSGAIGQASRTKVESTVMEHEFGHILGLVDIGTPMQANHKDASHSGHCNNSNCLMYYAAETTDILGFLVTGNIPSFDTNCINDLKANGGK